MLVGPPGNMAMGLGGWNARAHQYSGHGASVRCQRVAGGGTAEVGCEPVGRNFKEAR